MGGDTIPVGGNLVDDTHPARRDARDAADRSADYYPPLTYLATTRFWAHIRCARDTWVRAFLQTWLRAARSAAGGDRTRITRTGEHNPERGRERERTQIEIR